MLSYPFDYTIRKLPHTFGEFDENGLPLYDPSKMRLKKGMMYHPTIIIQYALAKYNLLHLNIPSDLEDFEKCATWLIENLENFEGNSNMKGWSIPFSIRTPFVQAPWFSSLTQAQGLSVLLRYYSMDRSKVKNEDIRAIIHSLSTSLDKGGLLYKDEEGNAFFEEAGQIHILNGCLITLHSVLEYLSLFKDEEVEKVCQQVIVTLEKWLPEYDTGHWSKYSLGLRFNLADLHYHQTHISQLNELGFKLNNQVFLSFARKWYHQSLSNKYVGYYLISRFLTLNISRACTVLKLNSLKYRR